MSIHRLQGLYRTATPYERSAGRSWYKEANLEVTRLADKYHVELGIAAGVVAVLSPGTSWEQNLIDADTILAGWRSGARPFSLVVTTYGVNKTKAWRILKDGRVFPHLNGPKVVPFYHNLCGDLSVPTIDSHAVNAWHGRRVVGSQRGLWLRRRHTVYRTVAADYTRAAVSRGIAPAQFQAIVWLTWKRRISEGKVPGYER